MIDLTRRFVELLASDPVSISDVVEAVGRPVADPGVPMPIEIAPFSSQLRGASLGRDRDSGEPFLLTLEPAPEHRPPLAELVTAFGPCRRLPADRGVPVSCVIDPAGSGFGGTVAVIVTLADSADGEPVAATISLRRDTASGGSP